MGSVVRVLLANDSAGSRPTHQPSAASSRAGSDADHHLVFEQWLRSAATSIETYATEVQAARAASVGRVGRRRYVDGLDLLQSAGRKTSGRSDACVSD